MVVVAFLNLFIVSIIKRIVQLCNLSNNLLIGNTIIYFVHITISHLSIHIIYFVNVKIILTAEKNTPIQLNTMPVALPTREFFVFVLFGST